jgi:hypothetical protein
MRLSSSSVDRRIPEAISWMQTMPGKGCNTILRLYSPLEPFFTKEWRPSEIGTNAKDGGARFFAAQNQAIAPHFAGRSFFSTHRTHANLRH